MPKIVGVAKGDPALAVGLMVLLMAATTVVLPLALPLLIEGVRVNAWEIARFLIVLLLLPLAAGLAFKARRAAAATRFRPVLERVSTAALLLMLVLVVALQFQGVLRIFGSGAILAALLFALLSSAAGWLLAGKDPSRGTELGLATGLRNLPAALVVSVQNFKDPDVSLMVLITTLTGILTLVPAARVLGNRRTGGLTGT
jgi:BASS family bile acid:Na+ symporter